MLYSKFDGIYTEIVNCETCGFFGISRWGVQIVRLFDFVYLVLSFSLQRPYFCLIIDTSHFGTALFSSDGFI